MKKHDYTMEREVEAKLTKTITSHGGECLKFVSPGWAGVPDRIILLPGGRIMFAETKRPVGGELSRLQKYWINRLRCLGFDIHVVWNFEDVKAIKSVIENYYGLKEIEK